MGAASLISIVGAVVSDFTTLLLPALPGSSTVGTVTASAMQGMLTKRRQKGFEILLEEVRRGDNPSQLLEDVEPVLAMLVRYQRATIEGTAHTNLRLMAEVLCGIAMRRHIVADEFQSWAGIIEGLRWQEIVAIARVHKYTLSLQDKPPSDNWGDGSRQFIAEMVPQIFKSVDEFLAFCQSASRTGLIMPQGDQNLFAYTSTSLMDELTTLADFDKAL